MKLKKTTASLIIMTLLITLTLAYLPSIATAPVTKISWMHFFDEPHEVDYFTQVVTAYEAETGVEVELKTVTFDDYYPTLLTWIAADAEPDVIYLHGPWIPTFANYKTEVYSTGLAIPPADVQADVSANWASASVDEATWKGIIWGYPAEFSAYALVYNRYVFQTEIAARTGTPEATRLQNVLNKLEAHTPLSYAEVLDASQLIAKWDDATTIAREGMLFYPDYSEGARFTLLSLLWSNGGEYLDLAVPETLFDGPEGLEVMQLVYDLGYIDLRGDLAGIQGCYDPANPWGMWWDSFTAEDGNGRLAMMVMPPWMNYLVWAMGEEKFDANLGISPNPIGPSGTESVSLTYGWLNTVSQKAEDEGRGDAAWDFLRWLNSPKAANEIAPGIPLTGGVSPMGDFLIMDSQPPGKIGDRESGDPRIGWWLQEFIDMAGLYGRGDNPFPTTEEAQYQIGLMFDKVFLTGVSPATALADAATAIQGIMPMSGDLDGSGLVDIFDASFLIIDIDATPAWGAAWVRGRSDSNEDDVVDVLDITILSVNYGKTGAKW